jgi:hypothetical protein
MKLLNLKIKPCKIHVLPHGGWLVHEIPDVQRKYRTNAVIVKSDGSLDKVARGTVKYSPAFNQYVIEDCNKTEESVVWSELGNIKDTVNGKFALVKDSVNCASGIFVCTGMHALAAAKKAADFKGRHRRLPTYYSSADPNNVLKLMMAAMPDFIVDAFVQGGKHKDSVLFLRVSTGENVSIEAAGLERLYDAKPSADGLTALVVDSKGKALLIDNPLES